MAGQERGGISGIQVCPHCGARVILTAQGACPSCRTPVIEGSPLDLQPKIGETPQLTIHDTPDGIFWITPLLAFTLSAFLIGYGWGLSGSSNPMGTLLAILIFSLLQPLLGGASSVAFDRAAVVGGALFGARVLGEVAGRSARDAQPPGFVLLNLLVATFVAGFLAGLFGAAMAGIANRRKRASPSGREIGLAGTHWLVSAVVALLAAGGLLYGHWSLYHVQNSAAGPANAPAAANIFRLSDKLNRQQTMAGWLLGIEVATVAALAVYLAVSCQRSRRTRQQEVRPTTY